MPVGQPAQQCQRRSSSAFICLCRNGHGKRDVDMFRKVLRLERLIYSHASMNVGRPHAAYDATTLIYRPDSVLPESPPPSLMLRMRAPRFFRAFSYCPPSLHKIVLHVF